ncbi:DUF1802 family protein [Leptothoe sp. PORK10 BA2]|uniref:DUF1802 family protein n=1 Tax=Leptothoe sp. PORK10 BA2 TaxID=3110254 RepID=UPI002B206FDA|nr:DUF1802 family protein [Leptothoe sp. PORK10 BA2]MEA5464860.1 DUF1802 family protein [Leptothoe sp. PORK10 BA2]
MVLLNTGLCLSSLEIVALKQGKSIVSAPKRFIAPGKRFLLIPSQELNDSIKNKFYRPETLSLFESDFKNIKTSNLVWAQCEFCQHITGLDDVESLSKLTLWNQEALTTHLRNKSNLFLAFIRVFSLSNDEVSFRLENLCDNELLNQIIPLPDYLNVSSDNPVLTDEQFQDARNIILDLQVDRSPIIVVKEINTVADSHPIEEKLTEQEENILDSSDWVSKIAGVGNSSDGNTFERLVRKSLITLGFANSGRYSDTSLDPNKLGGAGGLDFYCDIPYPIVGECKATKTENISDNGSGPAAQLIKLGNRILENHYQECIKLIIAAGNLTRNAKQTAKNTQISVLRPETLQRLVELKEAYPHSFNLDELKPVLANSPFSEEADKELRNFIDEVWKKLNIRSLLVETVRKKCDQDKKPSRVEGIRSAFNAAHAVDDIPIIQTEEETRDILLELSSPFTGYLGRKIYDGEECFFFLRKLEIKT